MIEEWVISICIIIIIAYLVARIVVKRNFNKNLKKLEESCVDKIMKQDNDYYMGDKKYDFKKDINSQIKGKVLKEEELYEAPKIKPKKEKQSTKDKKKVEKKKDNQKKRRKK